MSDRGLTLAELLAVMAIMIITFSIAIPIYRNWVKKVSIENDIKKIFAFMNEARAKAFSEKRVCGVIFSGQEAKLVCDTDMDNSILDEASNYLDMMIFKNNYSKNFSYAKFTKDGLAAILGTLYISDQGADPAYSCVTISQTRIKMGKWDGSQCVVK